MDLSITTKFAFELNEASDVLLQFEAAVTDGQRILAAKSDLTSPVNTKRVAAQDNVGERLWIRGDGLIEADYSTKVAIDRPTPDFANLAAVPLQDMPAETTQYLFDSRYCPAGKFQPFVNSEFGSTGGGVRIEAIRSWIAQNFRYEPGTSDSSTDARDSFVERRGICRDYAHVLVSLARASAIPARYVAGYAPQVNPPDFHAVAEVFLDDPTHPGDGAWHLIDATGMADAESFAKIGVGRDAADVSFLTAFGPCNFLHSSVSVSVMDNE